MKQTARYVPCEKCTKWFAENFGMPVKELKNGGLEALKTEVKVGKITLERIGIEVKQEKFAGDIIKEVNTAWKDVVDKEFEKRMKDEIKKEIKERDEEIKRLEKKDNENNSTISQLRTDLDQMRAQVQHSPSKKGDKLEHDMGETLKLSFPLDTIVPETKGKEEIDINQTVRIGREVFGTILVECKNTKKWEPSWIKKAKNHMKREKTEFCVIATTSMPKEVRTNPLGIEKDGIFVTEPENAKWVVAYYRLAMIRTHDTMKKVHAERKKIAQASKLKENLMVIMESKDFGESLSLLKELSQENKSIQKAIKNASKKIIQSTESIDSIASEMLKINKNLNDAFDKLLE